MIKRPLYRIKRGLNSYYWTLILFLEVEPLKWAVFVLMMLIGWVCHSLVGKVGQVFVTLGFGLFVAPV